jgi:hypothetical protein
MTTSQLKNMIKEELENRSKTTNKSKINESNAIEIVRATDVITKLFADGNINEISNILSNGISEVINKAQTEREITGYSDQIDELENGFESIIFDLQHTLSEVEVELQGMDDELEGDDYDDAYERTLR